MICFWFKLAIPIICAIYHSSFSFDIVTDGVSATLLYDQPEKPKKTQAEIDQEVRVKYDRGEFGVEIGIDMGMRTYIAAVRTDLDTGSEVKVDKKN